MRHRNDWGEWHHRAPDYKLVYCGPKQSSQEEAKKYRRYRLDKTYVTNIIDIPEIDVELNNKRKRLKLSAKVRQ